MKKNHGITIIELVIVMIIMILLVSFAVFSGFNSIEKAKATELYEEMNSMKNAVTAIMTQKILEEQDDAWLANYYNEDMGNGWYLVYKTGSGDNDLSKKYEFDSIKTTYMVNFLTGDIALLDAVEIMGRSIRTYEAARALVESDNI